MTTVAIIAIAVLAAVVALVAIGSWRDVRVARWTGQDPRHDRQARRVAAKQVRQHGGQ